jgi:spore cortex formation protein SpoVR/YcgB (stage V sporulation)
MTLLYETNDWNFETLDRVYEACSKIAKEELRLDTYTNQLEIISSDQMLDAYATVGLPIYYKHWSFGKQHARESRNYRAGKSGLAYEIVINSDPCINYLMEENSITTQTTVIAHAAFGHNHFFKNNYLFKEWTQADHIVDYLIFARDYIIKCEETYGVDTVETILDAAHALSQNGVFKYKHNKLNAREEIEKQREREEYIESHFNDLWRTVPDMRSDDEDCDDMISQEERELLGDFGYNIDPPEENILYFIEKNSPILKPWQREVVRIVRKIAQYFYPQYQTKVMNEGWATFTHYYIMNRLYETDQISEGSYMEFLHTHTSVLRMDDFDSEYFGGWNPYTLGFAMFMDIKRICEDPTDEDRDWFPELMGRDWLDVCLEAVNNYRDESFIRQFLSPKLMRDFKMFTLANDEKAQEYEVSAIHNKKGYKHIRNTLASQYEIINFIPDITVVGANFKTDRVLTLMHQVHSGKLLNTNTDVVLEHMKQLWGYQTVIDCIDEEGNYEDSYESSKTPIYEI